MCFFRDQRDLIHVSRRPERQVGTTRTNDHKAGRVLHFGFLKFVRNVEVFRCRLWRIINAQRGDILCDPVG